MFGIQNMQSEALNRRTDNTMDKGKGTDNDAQNTTQKFESVNKHQEKGHVKTHSNVVV